MQDGRSNSNGGKIKDELRDSTTTALTQLVHSQNHNSGSIVQEPVGGAASASGNIQEESKASGQEEHKAAAQADGFSLPHPEQLKSYEKMVAQIIRDSIEKENRALKQ